MKTQTVIFSTRGGNEFLSNAALGSAPNFALVPGLANRADRKFDQWTFTAEGVDPRFVSSGGPVSNNRGLVFKFNSYYPMPVEKIQVEAVDLPRFGMQTHFIGRVTMMLTNAAATVDKSNVTVNGASSATKISLWVEPKSVKIVGCWDGYDCNSPLEVLNKYRKILLASFDPSGRENYLRFVESSAGSLLVVLAPGMTLQFDIHTHQTDDTLWNYIGITIPTLPIIRILPTNATKFFGQLTPFAFHSMATTYGYAAAQNSYFGYSLAATNTGGQQINNNRDQMVHAMGRFTFPFGHQARLNARVVANKMIDRNFSRNMSLPDSSQLIAVFPFAASKGNSGYGANIQTNMFIKNPLKTPTDIYYNDDFKYIHSMEFWFTFGDDDLPLYEPYSYFTSIFPTLVDGTGYPLNQQWNIESTYTNYDNYGPTILNVARGACEYTPTARALLDTATPARRMETSIDSHDINSTMISDRPQPYQALVVPAGRPNYAFGSSFIQVLASMELSVFMNFLFCDCPKDKNEMYIDSNVYLQQRH